MNERDRETQKNECRIKWLLDEWNCIDQIQKKNKKKNLNRFSHLKTEIELNL